MEHFVDHGVHEFLVRRLLLADTYVAEFMLTHTKYDALGKLSDPPGPSHLPRLPLDADLLDLFYLTLSPFYETP